MLQTDTQCIGDVHWQVVDSMSKAMDSMSKAMETESRRAREEGVSPCVLHRRSLCPIPALVCVDTFQGSCLCRTDVQSSQEPPHVAVLQGYITKAPSKVPWQPFCKLLFSPKEPLCTSKHRHLYTPPLIDASSYKHQYSHWRRRPPKTSYDATGVPPRS